MHLDARIELVCNYPELVKCLVRNHVCRMWRKAAGDQGVVSIGVMHEFAALADALRRVLSPGGCKLDDGSPDHRTHVELGSRGRDDLGEEVLVAEAGYAASQHLCDGMPRTIANHLRACPALLTWPDPVRQPAFQRQE